MIATDSSSVDLALSWAVEHSLDDNFDDPVAIAVSGGLMSGTDLQIPGFPWKLNDLSTILEFLRNVSKPISISEKPDYEKLIGNEPSAFNCTSNQFISSNLESELQALEGIQSMKSGIVEFVEKIVHSYKLWESLFHEKACSFLLNCVISSSDSFYSRFDQFLNELSPNCVQSIHNCLSSFVNVDVSDLQLVGMKCAVKVFLCCCRLAYFLKVPSLQSEHDPESTVCLDTDFAILFLVDYPQL